MPDQLARIADLAREIADLAGQTPPEELAAPRGFRATYDASTRRVTCSWTPQADAVEVHERWKDPAATLKATVAPGGANRVSSELAGGPYEWAARSVRDGEVSPFTEWILTDVPREGDEPDDEDEPDEGDEQEQSQPGGPHPSDVLPVLAHWTIMLPTGEPGDPDNEYLVGKSIPDTYFVRDDEHGRGVVFRCHPATACHSENSNYGRTEGRQMVPGKRWEKSAWPSGTEKQPAEPQHLHARLRIDASRLAHPIVNGAQIHDGGDDVMQVQSRDGVLGIAHKDGDAWEVIDPDYGTDGAPFELDVRTTGRGELLVDYNGRQATRIEKTGSNWYWKVGCYPNTGGANEKRPEDPGAFAEVVVYALEVDPA